jgi:hypothetical protein
LERKRLKATIQASLCEFSMELGFMVSGEQYGAQRQRGLTFYTRTVQSKFERATMTRIGRCQIKTR